MEAFKLEYDNTKSMQLPDLLHCMRVAKLALEVCCIMKISGRKREEIYMAAMLHDIGKSLVDKGILNKKSRLENNEWNIIKLHSEFGAMLASTTGLDSAIIKNIIYHHENYDGTGYPRKIKGEKIPIGAAIIRVCDTYDALRMQRPYKKSFSHEEAIKEIKMEKQKYHPKVLTAFLKIDFEKI